MVLLIKVPFTVFPKRNIKDDTFYSFFRTQEEIGIVITLIGGLVS